MGTPIFHGQTMYWYYLFSLLSIHILLGHHGQTDIFSTVEIKKELFIKLPVGDNEIRGWYWLKYPHGLFF